jgi:hypothetical protein
LRRRAFSQIDFLGFGGEEQLDPGGLQASRPGIDHADRRRASGAEDEQCIRLLL